MSLWCLLSLSHQPGEFPYDFLYSDYQVYLARSGIHTIPLLNSTPDVTSYFEELPVSGLILTGGNDLSSEFFSHLLDSTTNEAPARDRMEGALLQEAIARKIPVLGICRGMQCINAYFGGGLNRMLGEDKPHVRNRHEVVVSSRRGEQIFGRRSFRVNSYHDQGIEKEQLHAELELLAYAKGDGLVEALHHKTLPILGIQWHPEREARLEQHDAALFSYVKQILKVWKDSKA